MKQVDEFFRFRLWLIAAADGSGCRLWFEFSGFGRLTLGQMMVVNIWCGGVVLLVQVGSRRGRPAAS